MLVRPRIEVKRLSLLLENKTNNFQIKVLKFRFNILINRLGKPITRVLDDDEGAIYIGFDVERDSPTNINLDVAVETKNQRIT